MKLSASSWEQIGSWDEYLILLFFGKELKWLDFGWVIDGFFDLLIAAT